MTNPALAALHRHVTGSGRPVIVEIPAAPLCPAADPTGDRAHCFCSSTIRQEPLRKVATCHRCGAETVAYLTEGSADRCS